VAFGPAAFVLWASGIWPSQTPLAVRGKALPSPSGNPIRQNRVLAALRAAPLLSNSIASPPSAFATWQISRNRRLRRLNLQISPDFPEREVRSTQQATRAKTGIGSVYDVWVKFI